MKRFFRYTALLAMVVVIAVGCLNDYNLGEGERDPREIRLWADVGYSPNIVYSPSSTRGGENSTSGIIDAATDTVLTLGMARIDEVYSPSYPSFVSCNEPILAELGEPNASNSYIRDI